MTSILNIIRRNNKKVLLLDTMKNCVITQNILEILFFDNTFENYSTNLNEYKKFKYSCNYIRVWEFRIEADRRDRVCFRS